MSRLGHSCNPPQPGSTGTGSTCSACITENALAAQATIANLTARVVELEHLKPYHHLMYDLRDANAQIADLTAQLSAMIQERDAHGAQREEAEKRLMDCQYSLADVTGKLAEAEADSDGFARQWSAANAAAVTAEIALREARERWQLVAKEGCLYEQSGATCIDSPPHRLGEWCASCLAGRELALSAAPQSEPPQTTTCPICKHPTHTGKCTGEAPNAQFSCGCHGLCAHGKDAIWCKVCHAGEPGWPAEEKI